MSRYRDMSASLLADRNRARGQGQVTSDVWQAAVDRAVAALRILAYMDTVGLDSRAANVFRDDLEMDPDGLHAALDTAADWLPRGAVSVSESFSQAMTEYRDRTAAAGSADPAVTFLD